MILVYPRAQDHKDCWPRHRSIRSWINQPILLETINLKEATCTTCPISVFLIFPIIRPFNIALMSKCTNMIVKRRMLCTTLYSNHPVTFNWGPKRSISKYYQLVMLGWEMSMVYSTWFKLYLFQSAGTSHTQFAYLIKKAHAISITDYPLANHSFPIR